MTIFAERTIDVPIMARVEGEGALHLRIVDGKIDTLQFKIYEPPRFFERFLQGRSYDQLLDTVARICGICPVAYQMSATHAVERLFGAAINPWIRDMRRVFYCGEWLESHALHIHLLAAPDFLGYSSAPALAKDFPEAVKRGLRIQALGNDLLRFLGARSVHPVGACVGGFYRAPSRGAAQCMLDALKNSIADADDLIAWAAALPRPRFEQDIVSVSLRHPSEYPMNEGNIISSAGLNIDADEFEQHFEERHVPQSTALQAFLHGRPYMVGPLARVNLNFDRLPPEIQRLAVATGIVWPSRDMFDSVVARAIEIRYCIGEAIRILERYDAAAKSRVVVQTKTGNAAACTEAPRGILWQRYAMNEAGLILNARIVPPTSQNQAHIEQDLLRTLTASGLDKTDDELRLLSEMVVRNYDPCISCSTHFLRLTVERF